MRLAAATVVAGGVLAAVAAVAPAADEPLPTRDCRSRGDASDGSAMRFARPPDVVVGPIAFSGLRMARTARLDRRDDGRFFVKAGAKVLWGRPVVLRVVEADQAALAAEYVAAGRWLQTAAVRFEPCPPGTPMFGGNGRLKRVTMFPGGFSFTRRGCYRIEAQAERGRVHRATIPLGVAACGSVTP